MAPGAVQQRVVEPELPHLSVHLEHLGADGHQLADVPSDTLLGVEGRRAQRLGHLVCEARRPVVEVRRDARPVRVGQRSEPSYAERAQRLDPLLVTAPVADRPLPADLRPGLVELRPDLRLDRRRQEVDVDVDQPGEAVRLAPGRNIRVGERAPIRLSHGP